MLSNLSIRNYALIEKLDIEFKMGFNVVTGETGAGKSIIIDAITLLLGGRIKPDSIRTGTSNAIVQGSFSLFQNHSLINKVMDCGVEPEDDEIIIRREINKDGKNRCFINGIKFPLQTLKTVGNMLVDIHGQNEHQSLLRKEEHIKLIDNFSNISSSLLEYREIFSEYSKKKNEYNALIAKERELESQKDFLEFRFNELKNGDLGEGREQELLNTINQVENSRKINSLIRDVENDLESGIKNKISKALKSLKELAQFDPTLEKCAETLGDLSYKLEDIQDIVRKSSRGMASGSLNNIDDLNESLSNINRLKRKYRKSETELIELFKKTESDIILLENSEIDKKKIESEIKNLFTILKKVGKTVTNIRMQEAKKMDAGINNTLKSLNMGDTCFKTKISIKDSYTDSGVDEVEFLVSTNIGEPLKSIARVVSGGELSRIMLAIKSVVAEKDRIPILIFDEVDTGIGGETAIGVGSALKKLSKYHQVFTVTHLHQIAKDAKHHFSVKKIQISDRIAVKICELSSENRIDEIARMLGNISSNKVIDHAKFLLEEAV